MTAPKYSLPECERRWLLASTPDDLGPGTLIEDRYLTGTRLRLRRETPAGGVPGVWKLARKYGASAPGVEPMTNLYLTPDEHALLATLPAAMLAKRRHPVMVDGVRFVVDRFEGALTGRSIVEVELASPGAVWAIVRPDWCGREVTGEPAYGGAALARDGWPLTP